MFKRNPKGVGVDLQVWVVYKSGLTDALKPPGTIKHRTRGPVTANRGIVTRPGGVSTT